MTSPDEIGGSCFETDSNHSSHTEAPEDPPKCSICLDLDWAKFADPDPWPNSTRILPVPYVHLLNSARNGCPTCDMLSRAISTYSEPLKLEYSDMADIPDKCDINIILRRDYTTLVETLGKDRHPATRLFAIELYTQPGLPSSWAALGPGAQISPELGITECMRFLSAQLESCDKTHNGCSPPLSKLPTRVIRVGIGRFVRLVESCGQNRRYVALSHCWGRGEGIVTTTTSTLKERLKQIALSSLPKTFRDAIQITRMLNVEYLWIDSLCIIQDSDEDWKKESTAMADVYSQSYLTIAATGSSNSFGGCLCPRWYVTSLGLNISRSVSAQLEEQASLPAKVKVRYANRCHGQLGGYGNSMMGTNIAPLLTRAWAFQERVLSPRTLHFHGEEMLWECQESFLCECGYLEWQDSYEDSIEDSFRTTIKKPFADIRLGRQTQAHTSLETWLKLVKTFVILDISRPSDRLPALSGLASCASKRLEGPYMAGIWKDDLTRGFLWRKYPYQRSRRVDCSEQDYIPTWSWSSIDLLSERCFGLKFHSDETLTTDQQFRLLSDTSSWPKNSTFLTVRDASLRVMGSVIACDFMYKRPARHYLPNHIIGFEGDEEFAYEDVTCDQEYMNQIRGMQVECLLVGQSSEERQLSWSIGKSGSCIIQFALILKRLECGAYERVGMFELDSRRGWFKNARLESVEII